MTAQTRGRIVFAVKVALAVALITWLVRGGALDFKKLGLIVTRPAVLAGTLVMYANGVFLHGFRWRTLLSLADVKPPWGRLFQLQMSALFFNMVVPGGVAGDILKSVYVARDASAEKRTTIFLVVFADRLLGLGGLIVIALLVTIARGRALWDDPLLRPMAIIVALLGAGVLLGPAVLVLVMRHGGERLERFVQGESKIAKMLSQLVAALRLMSARPRALLVALGFAMAYHAMNILFWWLVTHEATGQDVSYAAMSTIVPIGTLTVLIPISPSGLGVGHVAFDRLFAAVGLHGGATVFNLVFFALSAPCLFGVIPYLLLKRKGEISSDAPAEVKAS